jgi:hypothetical protein
LLEAAAAIVANNLPVLVYKMIVCWLIPRDCPDASECQRNGHPNASRDR